MTSCTHCLAEVDPAGIIRDETTAPGAIFCCPACLGIYQLISGKGLEAFYETRRDWEPGPAEPTEIKVEFFNDAVRTEGNENSIDIMLEGIRCSSCIWLIERFLARSAGITSARISHLNHRAHIQWDPAQINLAKILTTIAAIGYAPRPYSPSWHDAELERQKKDLLIRFGTAAFFTLQIMLFSVVLYEGFFREVDQTYHTLLKAVLWFLATPVVFYAGFPFTSNAFKGLKNGMVTMDTLVFVGSFSAYGYSIFALFRGLEVYFDTTGMIITLILLGRLLEAGARRKASEALTSLAGLQPAEARLIIKGTTRKTRVADLRVGEFIEVLPGDTIPLDGTVIEGDSEVDESALTGEPLPLLKSNGAKAFAGTHNLNGRLCLRVDKTSNATMLAHVVRAVEEAQTGKSRVQSLADRVIGWFVPLIFAVAFSTMFFRLAAGESLAAALMNGVAVLVIACPCALGLATPMAILAGSAAAARQGILIRGGDTLEAAAGIDTVIFDKTGTLTQGKPTPVATVVYDIDKNELQRLVASLENKTKHPLAKALKVQIPEREFLPVGDFREHPGKGIEGRINDSAVRIGSPTFVMAHAKPPSEAQAADLARLGDNDETVIGVVIDRVLKAWISMTDTARKEAVQAVTALKRQHISVRLFTGDNYQTALRIARQTGVIDATSHEADFGLAESTPLDKAAGLRQLRAQGRKIMMIGDGINDALALSEADVGVAMGGSPDIALKSAGAILLRNNLLMVPALIRLSRRTMTNISQNLFWAFSYNLVAVPLAVAGKIHPIVSAALMAVSSLVVIGNSLRIGRHRPYSS